VEEGDVAKGDPFAVVDVVVVVVVVVVEIGIGCAPGGGGDVDNCTAEPLGVFGIEEDGWDGGSRGAGVLGSVGMTGRLFGGIVDRVLGGISFIRVAKDASSSGECDVGADDISIGVGVGMGTGSVGCGCICGVIVIVGADVDIMSFLFGNSD